MAKIVFLPGMDGTGLLFKPLLSLLPITCSYLVISYPLDKRLDYDQLTEYVNRKLPVREDFILLAESFSGPIAYRLAQKKNRFLKKIIFVASFIAIPNHYIHLSRFFPIRFFLPQKMPGFWLKLLVGRKVSRHIITLVQEALKVVSRDVIAYRIKLMRELKPVMNAIDFPVIYLQAEKDVLVSAEHSAIIAALCHQFKQYRVPGSHFVLQVHPKECIALLDLSP